jgi:hypothetical protein
MENSCPTVPPLSSQASSVKGFWGCGEIGEAHRIPLTPIVRGPRHLPRRGPLRLSTKVRRCREFSDRHKNSSRIHRHLL